jgi:SNF2 family DNA or RNA helicase
VVIFTQYLGVMDLIGHHLKQINVNFTELRGDTQDRSARLHKFQTQDECKIFLCSLLAGGLGIDLTAGSVCIHFDRWWNPAKENQATDRLHRFGHVRSAVLCRMNSRCRSHQKAGRHQQLMNPVPTAHEFFPVPPQPKEHEAPCTGVH